MSTKHLLVTSAAAMTIALSGALCAQAVIDQATIEAREAKATGETGAPAPTASEQYMHQKVDAATAAEARQHANPSEANLQARTKAENEASAAFEAQQSKDKTDQLRR
ncbi:hypothetical protein [uncultured Thiodictyon sp.]|uniref:hypothetical protein n=1 Tax=uncultured Thiodictyon sp. TaxID=1846217 RepID=UPI0025CCBE55|nr:hypothetical protein [uncultured Thiodictyon sp.]